MIVFVPDHLHSFYFDGDLTSKPHVPDTISILIKPVYSKQYLVKGLITNIFKTTLH